MTASRAPRRAWRRAAAALAFVSAAALALHSALRPPRPLAPPPPGVALSGLVLVEPGLGRRADVTLVARGDRIEEVADGARPGASGAFAGRFALPGLVDLHVHHPPPALPGQRALFALLFLAHGVTSVRDAGSLGGALDGHAREIARGALPGPRTFACGPIVDGPAPLWPGARAVAAPDEAGPLVDELAAAGAACLKLYNELDAPTFHALVSAARARSLPVVAHVPWSLAFEELPGGIEVQHLMGLASDWHGTGAPEIERYAAYSTRMGIAHTPTLVTYLRAARLDEPAALAADATARLLPRLYRERLWRTRDNPLLGLLIPGGAEEARARVELMRAAIARLRAAGVAVRAGTDAINPFVVPGASLREELSALAGAGYTPEEVLALATRGAGEALAVPELGGLRPGAPADVALYREDPTRDLAALDSLEAVVAAGRLYTVEDLRAAAERLRAHADGFPYAPAADLAARAALAAVARGQR
jgi:imidazolonepropionase-like amidohydrolase